jgi:hypothetical protein
MEIAFYHPLMIKSEIHRAGTSEEKEAEMGRYAAVADYDPKAFDGPDFGVAASLPRLAPTASLGDIYRLPKLFERSRNVAKKTTGFQWLREP